MKVLFLATHPNVGSGYGRVANKISNHLASLPGVEVVYYAFQNYTNTYVNGRFIDPRIKIYDAFKLDPESDGGFGDKCIVSTFVKEKPDALFIYNDMGCTNAIMNIIPPEHMPCKKYLYLDMVYPWQNIYKFQNLKWFNFDRIWTFLDCWTDHMIDDLKFDSSIISTMVHGIDFETPSAIPTKHEAKVLQGFKPDDFLVVNMNRNDARKRWDTTIKAFLDFLHREKMNPRIKLFCGCREWDGNSLHIGMTIETECLRMGMDPTNVMENHIFINRKPFQLTDREVYSIYNAGDVGLSTTSGEGFGLTPVEHLYFNRPQIVTDLPVFREIMGSYAHFVEPKVWIRAGESHRHDGDMAICDYRDFADHLQYCFNHPDEVPNAKDYLKSTYSWGHMYKVLDQEFKTG